jgi:hypothetical protein
VKRLRLGFVLALAVLAVAGGLWVWWQLGASARPRTVTKNQSEIARLLDTSGWVSPHLTGPKLYMIAYRDCADCAAFQSAEFAKLQAAGVDTRVIVIARPDQNGQVRSTPAERTTVAELWVNRDWGLYQRWSAAPAATWTAPGLTSADGDAGRSAVIDAGRKSLAELTPLLKANGIGPGLPTFVWWDKAGQMRACACQAGSFGAIVRELGA